MWVVVVINIDAYPFLAISDLTCHLVDTGIGVSCCIVSPDSKETKVGSNNQGTSPTAGKNTGVVLVPCCTWKCGPTAIFSGVNISEIPGCHLLRQMSSQ